MKPIVYGTTDLEPFRLSNESEPLVFEKELVHVGTFQKDSHRFTIDSGLLSHWVATFSRMVENGVQVPVPIEHTENPEKRRGTVISMSVRTNLNGLPAIFGRIRFRDADAAKLAGSDVSIYVPPEAKDGRGNWYARPITHVAITDYPVVQGLEPFQAIAASLVNGDIPVSVLTDLAQKLGLQVPPGSDDDAITEAIVGYVESVKAPAAPPAAPPAPGVPVQAGPKPGEQRPPAASPGAAPGVPAAPAAPVAGPQVPAAPGVPPKVEKKPLPQPMAASFARLLKENRESKLDKLVANGNITKAARDEFAKQYCSDETLALSLSDDGQDTSFDNLISGLSKNTAIALGERSPAQLPTPDDKNPLLKDAEARAKSAKS